MNYTRYLLPALLSTLLTCNNDVDKADAYGNFEAIEVVVSAETQGRIMTFEPHEGEKLGKEQVIVVIDSTQLHLKKKQLQSGEASLRSKIKTLEAMVHANLGLKTIHPLQPPAPATRAQLANMDPHNPPPHPRRAGGGQPLPNSRMISMARSLFLRPRLHQQNHKKLLYTLKGIPWMCRSNR